MAAIFLHLLDSKVLTNTFGGRATPRHATPYATPSASSRVTSRSLNCLLPQRSSQRPATTRWRTEMGSQMTDSPFVRWVNWFHADSFPFNLSGLRIIARSRVDIASTRLRHSTASGDCGFASVFPETPRSFGVFPEKRHRTARS